MKLINEMQLQVRMDKKFVSSVFHHFPIHKALRLLICKHSIASNSIFALTASKTLKNKKSSNGFLIKILFFFIIFV